MGLAFGTALLEHPRFWDPMLLGVYLLVIVGTDDRFELSRNVRLVAHACAALLVVYADGTRVTTLGSALFFAANLDALSVSFTLLFRCRYRLGLTLSAKSEGFFQLLIQVS